MMLAFNNKNYVYVYVYGKSILPVLDNVLHALRLDIADKAVEATHKKKAMMTSL